MKVIVVGVGSMGWNHARVCSELKILAGVCDMDSESVKKVAEHFGVQGYTDLKTAIVELEPNAVIVATPTSTHVKVARIALENGLHVLVEKPLAIDVDSGKSLVDLANKNKLKLSVGHIERHNPVISFARNHLELGEWGDAITISSRRVSNHLRAIFF